MEFGSLFSGVGGIDLGMERAGWECAWQVESEPFRRAVLKTHWPEVTDDMRMSETVGARLTSNPVDCVCAGVPMPRLSRLPASEHGLAGISGQGYFLTLLESLREIRPTWFLFENVPGLLSQQTRDETLLIVLRVLMGGCRYGVSWRSP